METNCQRICDELYRYQIFRMTKIELSKSDGKVQVRYELTVNIPIVQFPRGSEV